MCNELLAFVHFQKAFQFLFGFHACKLKSVFAALGQGDSEIHVGAANKILPTARTSELTIRMGCVNIYGAKYITTN